MSNALVWELTKNFHHGLVKRRDNQITLSSERGNLMNLHNRQSTGYRAGAVDITSQGVGKGLTIAARNHKNRRHPAKVFTVSTAPAYRSSIKSARGVFARFGNNDQKLQRQAFTRVSRYAAASRYAARSAALQAKRAQKA
eukprot:TRINITY_DN38_c0_g1_i1.p2 TRINITY_DN38_c0_g1~~TRINITY_DN38_c0_g1_i1.p2  ORF type:complete len:140 (+),score=26.00 TRINITY_DN38_c0_g1_i1:178-597(+)